MKEYQGRDYMLPMYDLVVFTKIYLSVFWMISINGRPNLETASMKLKNC
jgi:hypothetical protein